MLTAGPASRIVWWPEKRHLDGGTLQRLAWMVEAGGAVAWLVIDPAEEESPGRDELHTALAAVGMTVAEEQPIGRGEVALRVKAAG